jgi:hypothetical protein
MSKKSLQLQNSPSNLEIKNDFLLAHAAAKQNQNRFRDRIADKLARTGLTTVQMSFFEVCLPDDYKQIVADICDKTSWEYREEISHYMRRDFVFSKA